MTNQSIIRDLKLGIATGDYKVTIDTNKLPGSLYHLFRGKTIKDCFDRGLVLCGSRALSCYKINGKELLNRKPDDWDFLMTQNQFLELCRDYNIYDFDLTKPQYLLNKSFATFHGSYGGVSHWFPCLIHLIILDELPNYTEVNGINFVSLDNIIESKIDLINGAKGDTMKHQKDINNIIVNTHNI